jgi:heat shock protein HtpX
MGNLLKTGFLLVVLTCLLVLVGGAIGGRQGMTIAFVLALVMKVGAYWVSDKIVLAGYGGTRPTPSPPGEIPSTPRWPSPKGSCAS